MLWPIMTALFLVGVMFCVVFPFFTYVPSSGAIGDSLPKARLTNPLPDLAFQPSRLISPLVADRARRRLAGLKREPWPCV